MQEVRLAWRSRATAALAIVLTLLSAAAAIVGHARFDAETAQRDRYQRLVGAQFDEQPDRHPHRVSHYGFLVFRPRAPLGFVDSGVESYAGTSIFLEAHRQNTANFSAAQQSGSGSRFGELTLAMVLHVLVPLFIFAVAGVSITREREAGTLTLLLCQGASWRTILTGKLAGALMVVGGVLAPGLLTSMVWLWSRSNAPWTTDLAARAASLVLAHAVFLTACAAIAVTVSAWHRTSRGALMTLLSLWVVLWVVVPRMLPAIGAALYPVPTRSQFDADVERGVRALGDSHNPNDPGFAAIKAQVLADHNVERIEELPFNYSAFVIQQGEQLTSDAYQTHMAALLDTFSRQSRLVDWASAISPYLGIRALSMALAGSDPAHIVEFERQAEAYRYSLIQSLNDLHMNAVALDKDTYTSVIEGAPSRLRIDRALFHDLPQFDYRPPDVGWAMRQHAAATLASLGVIAIIAAALLWTSSRRALAS